MAIGNSARLQVKTAGANRPLNMPPSMPPTDIQQVKLGQVLGAGPILGQLAVTDQGRREKREHVDGTTTENDADPSRTAQLSIHDRP